MMFTLVRRCSVRRRRTAFAPSRFSREIFFSEAVDSPKYARKVLLFGGVILLATFGFEWGFSSKRPKSRFQNQLLRARNGFRLEIQDVRDLTFTLAIEPDYDVEYAGRHAEKAAKRPPNTSARKVGVRLGREHGAWLLNMLFTKG